MTGFFMNVLDRIFAVVGALLFAQAPLFIQQYIQQLVGHVDELRWQVRELERLAGDKGVEAYVQKFMNHPDPDFSGYGGLIHATFTRFTEMTATYQTLTEASIFSKPFLFVATLKPEVFRSTFAHYDLGLPLTVEGAVYGFIGMLVGMGLYRGLRFVFLWLFEKSRSITVS